MSTLEKAKALLEHYAGENTGDEWCKGAEVREQGVGTTFRLELIFDVGRRCCCSLWYYPRTGVAHSEIGVSLGRYHLSPEIVARLGGCLIQFSDLMRQLKALDDEQDETK